MPYVCVCVYIVICVKPHKVVRNVCLCPRMDRMDSAGIWESMYEGVKPFISVFNVAVVSALYWIFFLFSTAVINASAASAVCFIIV